MKKSVFLVLLFAALVGFTSAQADVAVFPQTGHSAFVLSVAFSPDGRQALSGAMDNTLKLWDIATGREIRTFSGHSESVRSVAFSPDGTQILSGSSDKTLKLWDVSTGREIMTFSGHTSYVLSIAFSPDGRQALSGSMDNTLKLWDIATGREIRIFSGHSDYVNSVAFSPDGRQALSGSDDNTLKLWDVSTGREIRTFSGHSDWVNSVAFNPDGSQALSGADDGTLKLWDVFTGMEIMTFSGHTVPERSSSSKIGVESVTFSPDGSQILSGSSDRTLKLWDIATGREIRTFSGHSGSVESVVFSPDGKQALSGSYDYSMKLWDTATGREIITFTGYSTWVSSVEFSPDGRQILSYSDSLRFWGTATGREIRAFSDIGLGALSPDGSQILTASSNNTFKLWEAATGREIRSFSGHSGAIMYRSLAFSPDGSQALSGSMDKTFKLWDIATGQEIRTFSVDLDWVNLVSFSPDGKYILSSTGSIQWNSVNSLKLWDAATGYEIWTFVGHEVLVECMAFSPDGRQIISGTGFQERAIKLWDVDTGREIRTFLGHSGWVRTVAFSPDGRQILSGSDDNTLKLWDVATGLEIRTFFGHLGGVSSVVFSPDGRRIISGSRDGTIRLWETATGREIAQFIGFRDGEWIVITPDGYYNASADGDKYLNVRVGNNVFGIDQYRKTFYSPEDVTDQLTATPASVQQVVARSANTIQNAASLQPPSIIVNSPAFGSTITGNTVNVSIDILDDNGPVTEVRVLVNGNLYQKTEPNFQYLRWEGTLRPTQVGANIIEVITTGVSESRQKITFNWQPTNPPVPRKPDLYLLAIGVNQYDNISSLSFCANDARSIVNTFMEQEGLQYNRVYTRILADDESLLPTSDNIRSNLQFLNQGTAEDYYLLFFAGHGGDDGSGGFYFCPRDYNGRFIASRINSDEILSVLDLPGKRMVFLDSCHSGGVIGGQAISNDKLARVLKESTAIIFTASKGIETSQEMPSLLHGIFTYSIIKSLELRSGIITMFDLANDTMRETISLTNGGQNPTISALSFENFPIALRRTPSGSTMSTLAVSSASLRTTPPVATNPQPSWTPPPPGSSSTLQQEDTKADIGLMSWGIQQLFRR